MSDLPAPAISVVIPAPWGIDACLYLDGWMQELNGRAGEIIVVDGSDQFDDRSAGLLRHLHHPGATLQGLMTAGMRSATGDWALLTEDHCRPLPGVLGQYLDHVGRHPATDLVAGSVDNLTNREPWSFAIFSIGLSEFWREASSSPGTATNANVLFRHNAILQDELAAPGGLLNLTIPRLARTGRMTTCRTAAIDHIVHFDRRTAVDFEFACTAEAIAEYRAMAAPLPWRADIWDSVKRAIGCALIVPARTARNLRGTQQSAVALIARVAFVCAAVAWRLAVRDARRILMRRQPVRTRPGRGATA